MAKEKRILDKELRHQLTKEECYSIMDYLMVHFSDRKDYHYNYYFDTEDHLLSKRDITLRLRTIVKENDISYQLTLKIPTIQDDTTLEYTEKLDERDMRLLAYNNRLPEGEISELTSIHGGHVKLVNVIKVNRVFALYLDLRVYFDRISHRGKTYYEIGTRIDQSENDKNDHKIAQFEDLLSKFDIAFKQTPRRSQTYI